jgi:uncharacterized protein YggE
MKANVGKAKLRIAGLHSYVWMGLLLVGMSACQAPPQPGAAGANAQTLVVSGRGVVDVPKTTAQVSLGVEVQAETTEAVQQAIAQQSSAVVKLLLTRQDVTRLETTGISLSPRYAEGSQTIEGYSGMNLVKFQIAPDRLGKLLDEALAAGATRVDGVTLVASDEALVAAQKEAITKASREARNQADAALAALALKQSAIVGIQINGAKAPELLTEPRQSGAAKPGLTATIPNPAVLASDQRIEAVVTLQIRYQLESSK